MFKHVFLSSRKNNNNDNDDDKKLVHAVESLTGTQIEVYEGFRVSKADERQDSKESSEAKGRGQKSLKTSGKGKRQASATRNEHNELRPVAWVGGNSFKDCDHIPAFLRSA